MFRCPDIWLSVYDHRRVTIYLVFPDTYMKDLILCYSQITEESQTLLAVTKYSIFQHHDIIFSYAELQWKQTIKAFFLVRTKFLAGMKVKCHAIHFWFINAQYFKKHSLRMPIQLEIKHLVLLKYFRRIHLKVIWEVSATEGKIILKKWGYEEMLVQCPHSFPLILLCLPLHSLEHWLIWAIQQGF